MYGKWSNEKCSFPNFYRLLSELWDVIEESRPRYKILVLLMLLGRMAMKNI